MNIDEDGETIYIALKYDPDKIRTREVHHLMEDLQEEYPITMEEVRIEDIKEKNDIANVT